VNRRQFLAASLAAPYAVRRQLARGPVALVTCDLESRLALVDLDAFRIVGSIATLPDPRSIETVGDVAVVCHTAVGALSIVDRTRVRHVVRGLVEPRYTAAHPDGVHAFVTDSGRSSVSLVDTRRGVVVDRVSLPGWARHLTVAHDGSTVWVGLGSASAHVAVVGTNPLRRLHDLAPGFLAHDVGMAPDGRLWVTSGTARLLAVADVHRPADLAPQHVTFGRGRVFVTSGDSGTLHVLRSDGSVVSETRVPIGSYNVQYAYGYVVTPSLSGGTLAILDGRGSHLATVPVAQSCHDACILA
jgi:DNA-binding beta-propeller fold protein YncE